MVTGFWAYCIHDEEKDWNSHCQRSWGLPYLVTAKCYSTVRCRCFFSNFWEYVNVPIKYGVEDFSSLLFRLPSMFLSKRIRSRLRLPQRGALMMFLTPLTLLTPHRVWTTRTSSHPILPLHSASETFTGVTAYALFSLPQWSEQVLAIDTSSQEVSLYSKFPVTYGRGSFKLLTTSHCFQDFSRSLSWLSVLQIQDSSWVLFDRQPSFLHWTWWSQMSFPT